MGLWNFCEGSTIRLYKESNSHGAKGVDINSILRAISTRWIPLGANGTGTKIDDWKISDSPPERNRGWHHTQYNQGTPVFSEIFRSAYANGIFSIKEVSITC